MWHNNTSAKKHTRALRGSLPPHAVIPFFAPFILKPEPHSYSVHLKPSPAISEVCVCECMWIVECVSSQSWRALKYQTVWRWYQHLCMLSRDVPSLLLLLLLLLLWTEYLISDGLIHSCLSSHLTNFLFVLMCSDHPAHLVFFLTHHPLVARSPFVIF